MFAVFGIAVLSVLLCSSNMPHLPHSVCNVSQSYIFDALSDVTAFFKTALATGLILAVHLYHRTLDVVSIAWDIYEGFSSA